MLESIFIKGSKKTPQIDFNRLAGNLVIQGRSFPENPVKVYEPLVEWAFEYVKIPQKTTNLHLKLEYYNSSSLLWIVKIIKQLSKIDRDDSALYINLYIDNDDFDIKDKDEYKDVICSVFDNNDKSKVTIGIKIIGIDKNGNVVDESIIYI